MIIYVFCNKFNKNILNYILGSILLAINPYKQLSIYKERNIELYYNYGLLKSQGKYIIKNYIILY